MNKCLERVNERCFWSPGVFSYPIIPRCCPNKKGFFFHRHIYSLCIYWWLRPSTLCRQDDESSSSELGRKLGLVDRPWLSLSKCNEGPVSSRRSLINYSHDSNDNFRSSTSTGSIIVKWNNILIYIWQTKSIKHWLLTGYLPVYSKQGKWHAFNSSKKWTMTCFQLLQKVNYEQIKGEMGGFFSFPKRWHFIKALRGIAQWLNLSDKKCTI